MTIMRSGDFMKDKLFKKRVHIDWKELLFVLNENSCYRTYWIIKSKAKRISDNRCAYLALLHNYDKKILDAYRYTKDITVFDL